MTRRPLRWPVARLQGARSRLQGARMGMLCLALGGGLGLLGAGLHALLLLLTPAFGALLGFWPPGTVGNGGLMVAFGAPGPTLLLLPLAGALLGLSLRGGVSDPLARGVSAYHGRRPLSAAAEGVHTLRLLLAHLALLPVGRDAALASGGAALGAAVAAAARLRAGEARVLGLAGLAAGLGLGLHAPLAGAVVVAEMMYRRMEFEHELLAPALLASVAAAAVYGGLHGFPPLMGVTHAAPLLAELLPYALLALLTGGLGALLALLRPPELSRRGRTLAGAGLGAAVAALAFVSLGALGDGSGWLQLGASGFLGLGTAAVAGALLLTVLLAHLAGLLAGLLPLLAAGGLAGVALAGLLPLGLEPGAAALVGAAALLAASHNLPVSAALIVIAWGGQAFLPAALLAALVGHAVGGRGTIAAQVERRSTSPAHAPLVRLPRTRVEAAAVVPDEDAAGGPLLRRAPLPPGWVGLRVGDLELPRESKLAGLARGGQARYARADEVLESGDELLILDYTDRS